MQDEYFMQQAIALARKGSGYVHPNPMVGCVIVKDNKILSEGYHEYYGGPHAEVNAIKNLENKGFNDWDKVCLYVTLEPCAHFGKTPPCTNLIIQKGIKKVVIATTDPNPIVAGKGIHQLEKHGIEITTGVCEKQARDLNKRFFTFHLQKRPYIILKWAETKDGFISKKVFQSREENIISSPEALKIVHQWRSEEHSILVGYNTVLNDNPLLNVRLVKGKNPQKIVLDKYLSLNINQFNVFKGEEKVIIFNTIKENEGNHLIYRKIHWNVKEEEILKRLYDLNIVSVLIEGGSKTLQGFLDKKMFDEVRILKSKNVEFRNGIEAPIANWNDLKLQNQLALGNDNIIFLST
ncbi:MAG: riboflavin biosynthesis protein RibD [Bacteroidia bacterium]|nr:MAG: riboflavin biosynthesis protein RibD [Bacteroidia bacterium]